MLVFCGCALVFGSCATQAPRSNASENKTKPKLIKTQGGVRFRLYLSDTLTGGHSASAIDAWKRGNEFYSHRKWIEAERVYQRAVELDKNFGEAYTNLASLLWFVRRNKEAEQAAQHAVKLLPSVGVPHVLLGIAQLDNGKPDEAEKSLRQAIAIDEHPFAYHCLVNLLIDQKREKDARPILNKGLARWPDDVILLTTQANLLRKEHRIDEAIVAARRAVKLRPNLGIAHRQLGFALDVAGRSEEALAEFRAWAKLEPTSANAQNWLGIVLYATGRYDEARKAAERAISLRSDWAAPYRLLGKILSEQSDYQGALRALREAIRLEPDFAQTHREASLAYSALGQRMEAEKEHAEYLKLRNKHSGEETKMLP